MGALGTLLARCRLRALLRHPRRAGRQSGLEQLPRDGPRLQNLMSEARDEPAHDRRVAEAMRDKSRRSFLALGISAAASLAGWRWLRTRPEIGGTPYPLRRALEFNERLA